MANICRSALCLLLCTILLWVCNKMGVKNIKFFLKFPLFYLSNKEIQRGKIPARNFLSFEKEFQFFLVIFYPIFIQKLISLLLLWYMLLLRAFCNSIYPFMQVKKKLGKIEILRSLVLARKCYHNQQTQRGHNTEISAAYYLRIAILK